MACDFLVAVTVRFQVLFVFLVMEVGSRRILHYNVTAHPTADWTLQQFPEALPDDRPHQFLIHDRDSIFSSELDEELQTSFGLRVLRTPVRAPKHCILRTAGRNCTTRVSGFHDPSERRALTKDPAALGGTLQ